MNDSDIMFSSFI